MHTKTTLNQPLPRGPVLDWSSFKIQNVLPLPSIESVGHTALTSSGRAAIYQALLQLKLPAGSHILVPSYHSPSMIAPVILAHLNIVFFGLDIDGLPNLGTIDSATERKCSAMLVTHYFGLTRSLAKIRKWCDERAITLIEDCAHCYFGEAGERQVGAWGDYSTASLSKFFPMSEGGLLVSAHHPITTLSLKSSSGMAQLKGIIDILEQAIKHKRLKGLSSGLSVLFWLKNTNPRLAFDIENMHDFTAASMLKDCDMGRINQTPLWATMLLKVILPRGRIIANRHRNFLLYGQFFKNVRGAMPLFPIATESIAPYAFPLWVDDPERIYQALRNKNLPVCRWDRVWPETPHLAGDVGPSWSHHVLQLLCHQDLSVLDIERTALAIRGLLPAPRNQKVTLST